MSALDRVEIQKIAKRYGSERALAGVTLELRKGTMCALLGHNGAGKTTLLGVVSTLVRPTAGGILFGAGTGSQTVAVTDPASFFTSNAWVPVAIGVVLSLVVHVGKTMARPAANAASFGLAAPVLSTVEDGVSLALTFFAIVVPILVIVGIVGVVIGGIALIRRARQRKKLKADAPAVPSAPA